MIVQTIWRSYLFYPNRTTPLKLLASSLCIHLEVPVHHFYRWDPGRWALIGRLHHKAQDGCIPLVMGIFTWVKLDIHEDQSQLWWFFWRMFNNNEFLWTLYAPSIRNTCMCVYVSIVPKSCVCVCVCYVYVFGVLPVFWVSRNCYCVRNYPNIPHADTIHTNNQSNHMFVVVLSIFWNNFSW